VRATWLTDIHLNFLRPLALQAFYERIREEKPDILLVTGDPTEDVTILQDKANLAAIMKGGRFHKRPATTQH